jgi:Zn-dependent peptidase ImmA (M78 family)/transcriptional regulator with XRE-family HTH domain
VKIDVWIGGRIVALVAHPAALTLARESRGWTQKRLAEEMTTLSGSTVSQAFVSKAEAGRVEVSPPRLELYAQALGYPIDVFTVDPQVHGVGVGLVHHRKRASLGAPALRGLHAQLALARGQVRGLMTIAGVVRPHRFHRIQLGELEAPSDAAIAVRREWGLGPGPVTDLVDSLEASGGLVLVRDLGARELDAVTQWVDGEPPLFLVNAFAPADRFRFSLAHEIGHVVLHGEPGESETQEREADEFASEWLMPSADIRPVLRNGRLDLTRLLDLKMQWGVSMMALLRRAVTLGAVTDWQYRNLVVEMSALGYRTSEPGVLAHDQPRFFRDLITDLVHTGQYGVDQLAAAAGLLPVEFRQLYIEDPRSVETSTKDTL